MFEIYKEILNDILKCEDDTQMQHLCDRFMEYYGTDSQKFFSESQNRILSDMWCECEAYDIPNGQPTKFHDTISTSAMLKNYASKCLKVFQESEIEI